MCSVCTTQFPGPQFDPSSGYCLYGVLNFLLLSVWVSSVFYTFLPLLISIQVGGLASVSGMHFHPDKDEVCYYRWTNKLNKWVYWLIIYTSICHEILSLQDLVSSFMLGVFLTHSFYFSAHIVIKAIIFYHNTPRDVSISLFVAACSFLCIYEAQLVFVIFIYVSYKNCHGFLKTFLKKIIWQIKNVVI